MRQWPDLFEALVRETNWNTVSIGFESGSDRMLQLLNKECTEEDNYFAIDLLNRIGDDMERQGRSRADVLGQHHAGHPRRNARRRLQDHAHAQVHEARLPVHLLLCALSRLGSGLPTHRRRQEPDDKDNYHRFPDDEKVKGVDYQFYRELLAGRFNDEVEQGMSIVRQERKDYWNALAKA